MNEQLPDSVPPLPPSRWEAGDWWTIPALVICAILLSVLLYSWK